MWTGIVVGLAAGALVGAGAGKLGEDEAVRVGRVAAHRLLPAGVARVVGRRLPAAELVLGAALIASGGAAVVAVPVVLLLAAFAAGLTVNLVRGNTAVGCGCFAFGTEAADRGDDRLRWWHAARALGLAVTAALAVAPGVTGPWPERLGATLAGAVLALAVVAVGAVRAVASAPQAFTGPAAAAVAHLTGRPQ